MSSHHQRLARTNQELDQLVAAGRRVYSTVHQLAVLRDLVHDCLQELGVDVVFDPDTPADIKDYLLGTCIGAFEGAIIGGMLGVLIGALFDEPEAGLVLGLGVGAAAGATAGARAVQRGGRVRIRGYRTSSGSAAALLELA